jgi:hypothetical protein
MADSLLHYFDGVLGQDVDRTHGLDLEALGITPRDFSLLELPLTDEEVWNVIKELPADKAPGPDGMTGAFYKSAWPVIKLDVMRAINAFFTADRRGFYCLNGALITLLPKKPEAIEPITYLGAPLSTRSLTKAQYEPLVGKVAAKLPAWQGPLMNKSGRLILVKSTLSAMPIYLAMSDKLPPGVIKQLDRIRRNFLWTRQDASLKGRSAVASQTICRPTLLGGLRIIDLRLSGIALRTR